MHDVINPATEAVAGRISMGSAADVDKAVKAARAAFETWSESSVAERIALSASFSAAATPSASMAISAAAARPTIKMEVRMSST